MIARLAIVASFSLNFAFAAEGGPSCAEALSTDSVRTFLSKTLGANWDPQRTTRFEDVVLLEKARMPERDRHIKAVLVKDVPNRNPFVVVFNGKGLEMVEPGARGERVVMVDGRPEWTSDGGWSTTREKHVLPSKDMWKLADFFEQNRAVVAKLIAEQFLTADDLRAAKVMPFTWGGRASVALSFASFAPDGQRLFFVRDGEYWTAEDVTRNFIPHVDFLRIDGHLLYRRNANQYGQGNVHTEGNVDLQLVDDFDSKKVKAEVVDWHVGELLGSVPHKFRELLIAPTNPLGVKDLSKLRSVKAKEVPDGRTFTVLIYDGWEGGPFLDRIVSVLDEHSSPEYFRLQFLRPKKLRLDGGRVVNVVLRDQQWLTLPDPQDQVDDLLKGFGRGDVQSSR